MTIPFRAVSRVEAADARQDFPFATSEVQPGAQDQHCLEIELRIDGAPGHCHVWTTPADQGFFCRVAMVVGAVMSLACLRGD